MEVQSMKKNNQKFRLPLRAWLMYLVVIAFLSTGVTLSRYVTSTTGNDSAGVITFHDITITETGDFYEEGKLLLQPGVDLEKKAVVNFGGSQAAVYVFLSSQAEGFAKQSDNMQFTALDGKISWQIDSTWQYLLSENNTHVYYTALTPNTAIAKEIISGGTVEVADTLKNSELQALPTLSVSFEATAVQADGFGNFANEAEHAKAAWNAVSG